MRNGLLIVLAAAVVCCCSNAAEVSLDLSKLQLKNVTAEAVAYKGVQAILLTDAGARDLPDGVRFAIIAGTDFQDGAIEVELTGDTVPGAGPEARGFTGLAFRAGPEGARYESFYLRPKNGRSEDQLQRNHSAQYIAFPDFPWFNLKHGPGRGAVGLWIGPGTIAHFANLKIRR